MPHTSSAKKNLRKSEKRRLHNRAMKKTLKTHIKRVLTAADAGNLDALREEVKLATAKLDKAAARNTIHRNLAARKKSQLSRLLHSKETAAKACAK